MPGFHVEGFHCCAGEREALLACSPAEYDAVAVSGWAGIVLGPGELAAWAGCSELGESSSRKVGLLVWAGRNYCPP